MHWRNICHVHTAPFLYKCAEKHIRFCVTGHTTPHKDSQKCTKIAHKVDIYKTEAFEDALGQCERTKMDRNKYDVIAKTKRLNGTNSV